MRSFIAERDCSILNVITGNAQFFIMSNFFQNFVHKDINMLREELVNSTWTISEQQREQWLSTGFCDSWQWLWNVCVVFIPCYKGLFNIVKDHAVCSGKLNEQEKGCFRHYKDHINPLQTKLKPVQWGYLQCEISKDWKPLLKVRHVLIWYSHIVYNINIGSPEAQTWHIS